MTTTQTTVNSTAIILNPPYNGGADVDLANLLADLTLVTERTDPMRHIGLLFAVLQAMADGGMDVREHIDCAVEQLD